MRAWVGIFVLAASVFVSRAAVTRSATALPGASFMLTNQTAFTGSVTVHAVEEELPAGWTATSISHAGRFDSGTRKIRWGPFFDGIARPLAARITSAPTARGSHNFNGLISVDGAESQITGAASIFIQGVAEANAATRILPGAYSPGVAFQFVLNAQPAANIAGYAIEETLPEGWTAAALNHSGAVDGRRLKWGPFFDTMPRQLTCQVLPLPTARAAVTFSGIASFDGVEIAIGGSNSMTPLLSQVTRSLPSHYDDGAAILVALTISPAPETQIHSIIETLPAGWTASTVSGDGVFDGASRSIRWGPFFDNTPRSLTYQAQAPTGSLLPAAFDGQGVFDDRAVLTSGSAQILPRASIVIRTAPTSAEPRSTVTILNAASPRAGVSTWAVEQAIPAGWTIASISDSGSYDSANNRVKWGPFFDDTPRELSVIFTVGSQLGRVALEGSASFDGAALSVPGATEIEIIAPPSIPSSSVRQLPASLRPGSSFTLSNEATPAQSASVYAIEESLPTGWTATDVSDSGSYDSRNNTIKWGPFFDSTPRLLTARVTSLANATGAIPFSGRASFDEATQPISGVASLTISATPNRAPIAANDTFTRHLDAPLTIQVSRLLSNDSDPDGDLLTLTAAATSARGITVTRVGNTISYAPAAGFNETDSFTYSVSDFDGATATATVTVQPPATGATQNIISVAPSPTGALLRFGGIPGFSYDIQSSTTIPAVTWTTVARRSADQFGRFEYFDPLAAGQEQRYYRTQYVE